LTAEESARFDEAAGKRAFLRVFEHCRSHHRPHRPLRSMRKTLPLPWITFRRTTNGEGASSAR
jgi:hypothetical protein